MSTECTYFLKQMLKVFLPALLITAMLTLMLQICDPFLVSGWHDDHAVCFQAFPKQACLCWLRSHTGKLGRCTKAALVFSLMCFLHLLLLSVPELQTRTGILVLEEPLHHLRPKGNRI